MEKEIITIYTKERSFFGYVTKNEDGVYITHGQLGQYNEFNSFEKLFEYLLDFGVFDENNFGIYTDL